MKLNKIIVFLLFILTITVSGFIVNFQNKEYNLLDQRYEALKQAYTKLEETSKQVKNNDPTIKKLRKKVSNLQKKLNSENESDSLPNQNYLQIKYWYDNKNYELSDKNQKLYKNPFLSKKILDKVIFVSSTISEIELENGQTVYSAMSSEGLVYSSSYIDLIELNSTNY